MLDPSRWRQFKSQLRAAATQALAELDSDPRTHLAAGIRALERGDNKIAADCFYRAFQRDPNHVGALYGLSEALVADKEYERAVPIYEMIVGMAEDDYVSRFNLAVILSRLRRFGQAEDVYRRLLEDRPDALQARYNLATLYQVQGKLAAARDQWRKVITDAPHLPSAHAALAEVCMDMGDPGAAMASYAEAAKLRPKEVSSWRNLALAAERAGNFGTAIVATRRAAALAPADARPWARLGRLQLELHRRTGERRFLAEAIEAWRKSLQLDPDQKDIRDWLETYEGAERQPATIRKRP